MVRAAQIQLIQNHGTNMPRKKQGPTLEDDTRAKIARCLPSAIDYALQSYRQFYDGDHFENAKEFSAHHTACKAAIAHIELLLKLAAWANLPSNNGPYDDALTGLLADARSELENYHEDDDA